jgi:hypothetical protein
MYICNAYFTVPYLHTFALSRVFTVNSLLFVFFLTHPSRYLRFYTAREFARNFRVGTGIIHIFAQISGTGEGRFTVKAVTKKI